LWLAVSLQLRAATLTPRLSNSALNASTEPSSVVQTGVKSAGYEKRTAQEHSMNLCHSILPCVDSASPLMKTSPRLGAAQERQREC